MSPGTILSRFDGLVASNTAPQRVHPERPERKGVGSFTPVPAYTDLPHSAPVGFHRSSSAARMSTGDPRWRVAPTMAMPHVPLQPFQARARTAPAMEVRAGVVLCLSCFDCPCACGRLGLVPA